MLSLPLLHPFISGFGGLLVEELGGGGGGFSHHARFILFRVEELKLPVFI